MILYIKLVCPSWCVLKLHPFITYKFNTLVGWNNKREGPKALKYFDNYLALRVYTFGGKEHYKGKASACP